MRSCCFPRSQLCQVSIPQPHSILPQCSSCSGTVFSKGGPSYMEQDTEEAAVSPSLVLLACVPRNVLHVRHGLGAA